MLNDECVENMHILLTDFTPKSNLINLLNKEGFSLKDTHSVFVH